MLPRFRAWAMAAMLCTASVWNLPARAEVPQGPSTTPPDNAATAGEESLSPLQIEARDAYIAAIKAATSGPHRIPFAGQGYIDLPKDYLFVPRDEAARFMRSLGNTASSRLLGVVLGPADSTWFATIQYLDSGYIRDEEAKNWNADELLQQLRDGTEADNEQRIKRGFPPLDITGWIQKPTYDQARRQLVWSVAAYDRGTSPSDAVINYNTYALGREGYFGIAFITPAQSIETDKHYALALLEALSFTNGKRYEDFNESTDKVAAYGIAALVAGVGAKKLGLIAIIAGFAAKFAKAIAFGVIALGVFLTRIFRRKPPGGTA